MKRSRWFTLVALLAAFTLLGAACGREDNGDVAGDGAECPDEEFGCVEVAPGDPIKIGSLLVISGPNASLGEDSNGGIEVALQEREEVLGHEVELVKEDDGCAEQGGQAGAQRLVSDPQIVAVIGTSCSSAAVPASEILSEQGILLFSPSNTGPNLTDPDQDYFPFYARTAHNDLVQGAAMAQFIAEELDAKTAATIHDGSPYAEGLANAMADSFKSEFNGEITNQEAIQVGEKDFRPVLTSIAADNPDFLYYPVFIPEGAAITQQAKQTSGLAETELGGADGMFSPDFIDAAGQAANGVYLSGPDLDLKGDYYKNEFLPAYKEVTGSEEPLSVFHAHAYDATNILLDAIEEVAIEQDDGTLLIPRTQLRDEVYETEGYDGLIGELTCNDTGDCNAETQIAVSVIEEGDFNPVFTVTLSLAELQG